MAKRTVERVKLGIFVLAGLILLIAALFTLSQNRSLFGGTITVKTTFRNVGGLIPGNNVRYSGITIGVVDAVKIVNDTTVEVRMLLDENMQSVIRKNARASLGTDGIIGNRLVNISPEKGDAPFITSGDYLTPATELDTDAMLRTLGKTNENIADISEHLLVTLRRFSESPQLEMLLNDESMSANLIASFANIRSSTDEIHKMLRDLRGIVEDVKAGEGSVGQLLRDTTLASNLNKAVENLHVIEANAEKITHDIDSVILTLNATTQTLETSVKGTDGPVGMLLNDTTSARQIQEMVIHLNETSVALKENMEAMRHNFLLRGYFKDQEKEAEKQRKEAEKAAKKAAKKNQ
jgi:phospholipid/cholesterol/gamma-HCH transport system substrate-binding protein